MYSKFPVRTKLMGCASLFDLILGWRRSDPSHKEGRKRVEVGGSGAATLASGTSGILSINLPSPCSVSQTCTETHFESHREPIISPHHCWGYWPRYSSFPIFSNVTRFVFRRDCTQQLIMRGFNFESFVLHRFSSLSLVSSFNLVVAQILSRSSCRLSSNCLVIFFCCTHVRT